MSYTEQYWRNPEMIAARKRMMSEEGYEEVEGCRRCIKEKCLKEHRGFTMDWRVIPNRKCDKHPKFYVKKALLESTHKVA